MNLQQCGFNKQPDSYISGGWGRGRMTSLWEITHEKSFGRQPKRWQIIIGRQPNVDKSEKPYVYNE